LRSLARRVSLTRSLVVRQVLVRLLEEALAQSTEWTRQRGPSSEERFHYRQKRIEDVSRGHQAVHAKTAQRDFGRSIAAGDCQGKARQLDDVRRVRADVRPRDERIGRKRRRTQPMRQSRAGRRPEARLDRTALSLRRRGGGRGAPGPFFRACGGSGQPGEDRSLPETNHQAPNAGASPSKSRMAQRSLQPMPQNADTIQSTTSCRG